MKNHLNRRALLQGLGTVSIGLPLLEEMITPTRSARVGQGARARIQRVLRSAFPRLCRTKALTMCSNRFSRSAGAASCVMWITCAAMCAASTPTLTPPRRSPQARRRRGQGGRAVHRSGDPPRASSEGTGHGAYAGGRHLFRRSRVGRYHHSYTLDGTVAARMQEKPRDLFDRVFGTLTNADDADARTQRLKRSVLDSVVDQYRFTGPNSRSAPLPRAV